MTRSSSKTQPVPDCSAEQRVAVVVTFTVLSSTSRPTSTIAGSGSPTDRMLSSPLNTCGNPLAANACAMAPTASAEEMGATRSRAAMTRDSATAELGPTRGVVRTQPATSHTTRTKASAPVRAPPRASARRPSPSPSADRRVVPTQPPPTASPTPSTSGRRLAALAAPASATMSRSSRKEASTGPSRRPATAPRTNPMTVLTPATRPCDQPAAADRTRKTLRAMSRAVTMRPGPSPSSSSCVRRRGG